MTALMLRAHGLKQGTIVVHLVYIFQSIFSSDDNRIMLVCLVAQSEAEGSTKGLLLSQLSLYLGV